MSTVEASTDAAFETTAFQAFVSQREVGLGQPLNADEIDTAMREFAALPAEVIRLLSGEVEASPAPTPPRHPRRDFIVTLVGGIVTIGVFSAVQFGTGHTVLAGITFAGGILFLAMLVLARLKHAASSPTTEEVEYGR